MALIDDILKIAAKKFLVDELVDPDTAEQRINVCVQCNRFDSDNRRCKVCKCYMDIKTTAKTNLNVKRSRYEITHCPLGRWNDLEIANEYRKMDGLPVLNN